ncbi:MAG TPA: serine hydrolase [Drouetiella sp.]
MKALLLGILAVLAGASAAQASEPYEAELDKAVESVMQTWHTPGIAVAIVKDDKVVLAKGYGVRSLESKEKVDADTVFAIGSCTKAFTSAGIAREVGEKKMSWDAPAITYLPNLVFSDPYMTANVTTRDLCSMRSGLDRAEASLAFGNFTREQLIERIRYQEPVIPFRSGFTYVNQMFVAAGEILHSVSHQSWESYIKNNFFTPLGMSNSYVSNSEIDKLSNVAQPHHYGDGKTVKVSRAKDVALAPAGAICSTANDMARWVSMQLNDGKFEGKQILDAHALAETHAPQTVVSPDHIEVGHLPDAHVHFGNYCLGWGVFDYRGKVMVNHTGAIDGMRAQVAMFPEEKLGIVILTNCDYGQGMANSSVDLAAADLLLGLPKRDWSAGFYELQKTNDEKEKKDLEDISQARVLNTKPSLPLSSYAGKYTSDLMGDMTVTVNGQSLVFTPPAVESRGVGNHWNYDTFRIKFDDAISTDSLATFSLNALGKPASLTISDCGTWVRRD